MRASLSGLTMRGRCFIGAGLAAILCGLALGQDDLFRVGLLILALPLVAVAVVARSRYRLACERRVTPGRLPVGHDAEVSLRVDNLARIPTGLLLLEDRVPYALGTPARFMVNRIQPRSRHEISHRVGSDVRGRFQLGPLSVRLADPFGLVELSRFFTGTSTLVVTPTVVPLPRLKLLGDWAGDGTSHSRSVAAAGEDDVATREYRHGDDLRRVHWPSTAHCGELMVRREEQHWQSRCVMLLDSRRIAHRGEGPGSSFESAVSAAASVGVHLLRNGYTIKFFAAGCQVLGGGGGPVEGALLETLATLSPTRQASMSETLAAARRERTEGVLVVVLGALEPAESEQVARLARGGASCIALLLDTTSWLPLSADARARAEEAHDASARVLRQGGWRVLPVDKESRLDVLWQQAELRAESRAVPVGGAR